MWWYETKNDLVWKHLFITLFDIINSMCICVFVDWIHESSRIQGRNLPGCSWFGHNLWRFLCPLEPGLRSVRPDTSEVFRKTMEAGFWLFLFLQKYEFTFYTAVDGHFPSLLKMLSTCNLMLHYQLIRLTAKDLRTMLLHSLDAASKHLQLDRCEGVWPTGES